MTHFFLKKQQIYFLGQSQTSQTEVSVIYFDLYSVLWTKIYFDL